MVNGMKKIATYIITSIYLIIVFFVTFYILTFNKFNVSDFGNITIFVSQDLEGFQNGNMVIANKKSNININDTIIFYDTYTSLFEINTQEVVKIEKVNNKESTYTLKDKHLLPSSYVISNINSCIKIPYAGYVLNILSSQLGYLVFIVLPILFFLIYLIHNLREELKKNRK